MLAFVSHGRHDHPELAIMVGYLASPLHLRVRIAQRDSFIDILKPVESEFRTTWEHRDDGRLHNFMPHVATDLAFNWLSGRRAQDTGPGGAGPGSKLKMQPYPVEFAWSIKFAAFFSYTVAGIGVTVNYRPDMVAAHSIERFARNLRAFAEEWVRTRSASIALTAAKDSMPGATPLGARG